MGGAALIHLTELPTATIDFTAATTALGTWGTDVQTFMLAQGLVIAGVLALVGGFVLVVHTIRKRLNLRKGIAKV